MMTRRTFVGALAGLAAAGGLGSLGWVTRRRRLATADLSLASANQLRGSQFQMKHAGGDRLQAVVIDVATQRHPARRGAPATEQISVLLQPVGPAEPLAGNYALENSDLKMDSLYLSPVGRQGRERCLEAAITRIV